MVKENKSVPELWGMKTPDGCCVHDAWMIARLLTGQFTRRGSLLQYIINRSDLKEGTAVV